MPDTANKPVVFLAFANDRDDTVGYLRNLPNEARRLREVLEPAVQAGLCEVVVRSNCTAGDIFKVFQDPGYRNRIAIFHYGGHANGYQLLLESASGESAAADAGGLAGFLAQQQGLQLVFLNGCSTQEQTDGLLEANIPAVISTSRAIDDQVATDFSHQFYQGLASGASVRTAFNEAAAAARTAKGGTTRGMYFGGASDSQSTPAADRWPWDLYLREGSDSADQWNLPDAVNDPLFGLPPLAEQDLPESPYRHLNWFTRKDAEVFFGRGHQIRELYDRLTALRTAPIVLFYGQSGVGKSSILDAGLIPRLERDYEVRYLRRNEGGLLETLQSAFPPEDSGQPVASAWRFNEEQTGRPLIVFLDQVEELYTHPVAAFPEELDKFLEVVKSTFGDSHQRPLGKLVLGFRKEWLAELESRLVEYELPRTKVFLEPLDRRGIIEVVQGPTRSERLRERYGLSVAEGLAEIIADDLLEDRDSAIAPTLQILLTKLWTRATEENYEQPHFSQTLYQDMKRDGILLRDFLNQQISKFRESYPEAVDSGLLLDIVALHTTALGTAGKCSLEQLQQQYAHLGATLPDLLQQCQDLHLLTVATTTRKDGEKITRLAHDTLAPLVRERFDESDKPGQRARRILDNRSVDWNDDLEGTPLDDADLALVEQGIDGTRALNPTELRLVEASRNLRNKLQRTRRILKITGATAIVLIIVTSGMAMFFSNLALKNAKEVHAASVVSLAATQHDPLVAYQLIESIPKNYPEPAGGAKVTQSLVHRAIPNELLTGHTDWVNDAAYSPDGKWIVTASEDKTARVWSTATGKWVSTLGGPDSTDGHADRVISAAFSPDSKRIVTTSLDNTARVWTADASDTSYRVELTLEDSTNGNGFGGAAISRHNDIIMTTSMDSTSIGVWKISGEQLPVKPKLIDKIIGAALTETGMKVVTVCDRETTNEDKTPTDCRNQAYVWSADIKERFVEFIGEPVALTDGHTKNIVSASFSQDGQSVVTTSDDKTARVWNSDGTGKPLVLTGHKKSVISAKFNRDSNKIVTTSWDNTARVWSRDGSGEALLVIDSINKLNSAAFSSDGENVVIASNDNVAGVWNAERWKEPMLLADSDRALDGAAFSSDGTSILTASVRNVVKVWNVTGSGDPELLSGILEDDIYSATFSANGTCIVTRSKGGMVRMWNTEGPDNDRLLFEETGLTGLIGAVCTTNGVPKMATVSSDFKVKVLNAKGITETTLEGHTEKVNSADFSSDGQQIVTASEDDRARVWDAGTGKLVTLLSHSKDVYGAKFSPDNKKVVTFSKDNYVRVWEADDDTALSELKHPVRVFSAALSPDNLRVVTTSLAETTARVWNADGSGEPLVLSGHTEYLNSATFSPDSQRVVTTSADNTARVWRVGWNALTDFIRQSNNTCLSIKDRERFLLESLEKATIKYEECNNSKLN